MMSPLSLAEIAREIPGETEIVGDGAIKLTGVHHDSRAVTAGDLFVVRKGATSDGARFLADARANGAAAVLAAKGAVDPATAGLPVLFVADVADGLAYSAAAVYGHPAFSLEIVGITGTNGKTTTTHLVRAAVDAALGRPSCGTVGTIGHIFAGKVTHASHTTPEADELARVLASMRKAGASHVAMEVSSHALDLGRVRAVRFRVAALTNLTQDHLDFHGTMEAYAAAKRALFTTCAPGSAVLNVGDAFGRSLVPLVKAPLVRVSAAIDADADIAPLRVTMAASGMDVVVKTPKGELHLETRLVGAHNLENIVVALGIAHALDLDLERAAKGIAGEVGAPGRLERCDSPGDDVTVLVDYAHTPDALARVLDSVKSVAASRLWCVFGCGGDRDATKRGPMGEAAAVRADAVVITSDNPRTEEPAAIAAPIEAAVAASGLPRVTFAELGTGARGYTVELDRAAAIAQTIQAAAKGDVVVLAGKGHEDYQIVGAVKRHFDDREEAKRALATRRAAAAAGGVS
jgi:UDP-N-acetylmuramoyl-L-alanyl-D-glutamate--2,6-diaminopimelate ligase